jgi:flagellar hook-associated protein 2
MSVVTLGLQDGTSVKVPVITDSSSFKDYQFRLGELTGERNVVSVTLNNNNTNREVTIQNLQLYDPTVAGGLRASNSVTTAQDAIIAMDGIEVTRPTNKIDDLIPGVTLTVSRPTTSEVSLKVSPDRESVKEAIIEFVGNYNRLMTEINILTRRDPAVISEISYLTEDERKAYEERLGLMSGETTLTQMRTSLQRGVTSPYPTDDGSTYTMLAQIGIGTDLRRTGAAGGYDQSRLRGYMEIDEKTLDAALETDLPNVKRLFGYDSDGDLVAETGAAFNLDRLTRPYVETGGIITLKTNTIDSRITRDNQKIETLDRQLAQKEANLKVQYAQMENAYNQMESMTNSLDNFSRQGQK